MRLLKLTKLFFICLFLRISSQISVSLEKSSENLISSLELNENNKDQTSSDNYHKKTHSLRYSATKMNDINNNKTDDIPVFLGGIKPLSDNQKSPTFMPIEKGVPTNKALNGEEFENLNYTKANNIVIHLKNQSQPEISAGYYGESRVTYY